MSKTLRLIEVTSSLHYSLELKNSNIIAISL